MEELLQALPEPMVINSTTLMIAAIFLVTLVILNNLVFKPVNEVLEDRARRIEEGEAARRKANQTVKESLDEYQRNLVEARRAAQNKRNEILKESELVRNEIVDSAREKALGMVQAAATEVDKQVEGAKSSLKQETSAIADKIVAAVLAKRAS